MVAKSVEEFQTNQQTMNEDFGPTPETLGDDSLSQPIQGFDMSVKEYYNQFCIWISKLEAVNSVHYVDDEEWYVVDFLFGLKMDLMQRVFRHKGIRRVSEAFRLAEIEETSGHNDAYEVFEDVPNPESKHSDELDEAEYFGNTESDDLVVQIEGESSKIVSPNADVKVLDKLPKPALTETAAYMSIDELDAHCVLNSQTRGFDQVFGNSEVEALKIINKSTEPNFAGYTFLHSFTSIPLFGNEEKYDLSSIKIDNRYVNYKPNNIWLNVLLMLIFDPGGCSRLHMGCGSFKCCKEQGDYRWAVNVAKPLIISDPLITRQEACNEWSDSNVRQVKTFILASSMTGSVNGSTNGSTMAWFEKRTSILKVALGKNVMEDNRDVLDKRSKLRTHVDGKFLFVYDPGGSLPLQMDCDALKFDNRFQNLIDLHYVVGMFDEMPHSLSVKLNSRFHGFTAFRLSIVEFLREFRYDVASIANSDSNPSTLNAVTCCAIEISMFVFDPGIGATGIFEQMLDSPNPRQLLQSWNKVREPLYCIMVGHQSMPTSFILIQGLKGSLILTDPIGVILGMFTILTIEVSKEIDPKKDWDEFIVLMGHWEGTNEDIGSKFPEFLSRMIPAKPMCNLTEYEDDSPVTIGRAENFFMHILGVSFAYKILEPFLFISCHRFEEEYHKKALETTFGEFTLSKYLVFVYDPGRWYNPTLQRIGRADPILLMIKQSFGYENWVVCISKWSQSVLVSLTDQDGIRELNNQLLKCTYVSFRDLFSFSWAPNMISIVHFCEKHWVTKFLLNGNGSNKMNIGLCSHGYDGVTIVEFHVFIWDPGKIVNSLYILEDKDVVERVGKDMILMDTTWMIRRYNHEVQMSCLNTVEDFGLFILLIGLDTSRLGIFEVGLIASDLKHFKQYSDSHGYDDVYIAKLQNLVWDPGQNNISVNILEDMLRPKRVKLHFLWDILYASRGLPNGYGNSAAASLVSSILELEHFIWDPGSFISILQAFWKDYGVNFHFTTLRTRWFSRGRICHDIAPFK